VKLVVDGEEVRDAPAGTLAATFGEVVGELLSEVISVALDGRVLDRDDQTRVLDEEQSAGEELALTTVSTAELARATLDEVLKHLDVLRDGLRKAVDHLGRGERIQALECFRPTLEIWMAICEAVQKVCVIVDVHEVGGDGEPDIAAEHGKIVAALGEIQSAFEQQDWVKLSDLLEYEMLPAADAWEGVVRTLALRLQVDAT